MSTSRSAFHGRNRKLVLAFDVGTTYSGISYCVLDPGVIPGIQRVTRFPANEYINGASKIPTIIYYDRAGNVKAVGAEAVKEGIYQIAEVEHWVKAEWFKLHLRSRVGAPRQLTDRIPPLPLKKTVVEVLADFLAYLLECASSFIQKTHASGGVLWASVKDQIHFVLSHPNAWEGAQQAEMRKASVLAKLIPDTTAGHTRLSFVTEGEASLHFAVQNGLSMGVMEDGEGVVIVDAGDSTIDVSSYSKKVGEAKNRFEEVATPQCHFHGSVFVTVYARLFLENYLQESTFVGDLDNIVECFDRTTKLRFRNSDEPQYIKFGGAKDNDQNCNIRFRQLKLLGSDVASFFEPSVECIVNSVLYQCKVSRRPISHVVLVGEFATSDWLFKEVREKLLQHDINITRPQNHVNKAVSDGALSFYQHHYVVTQSSGTFSNIRIDPAAPDHQERPAKPLDRTTELNGESNIAPLSGHFGGIGRSIAGAILGPGGPAQPPRDRTKEELQRTKTSLQQLEYELRRVKGDLHRTCFELENEIRSKKDTIRSLQHENANIVRELQEYKNLSEIRGRKLIGAQVFLTKPDLLSISDVKDMVNTLNDENFQASASLGDALVHSKYELDKEEWAAAYAQVCRTVSEPLANALRKETQKPEPEVNLLLVQVVLEMYLVHFCSSLIESWFPNTRETSDFLSTIYSEIRRTEEQAVSGRWRALTRAQIRPTSTTWKDEFMLGLGHIFKIAAWDIGSPDNLKAFEQKLSAIFKAVEDLRLALGEKITSIDLEVNVVAPGFLFDHRWMHDGYGDARQGNMKKSAEVVVGTTGIGLKKVITGDVTFENILAPKVILASTLKEALLPPPPPPPPSRLKRGRLSWGEGGQEGWRRLFSSTAPPPVKEVITTMSYSRSHTLGLTKNHQMTAVDNERVSSLSTAQRGDGRDP